MLIGRVKEQTVLREALESRDAELVAVYGRRRIGKTFLVRQFFGSAIVFELTGTHDGTLAAQLEAFATALGRAVQSRAPLAPPRSWAEAFRQLEAHLVSLPRRKRQKHVVFLDELPWLATRRSGFLAAFEHFWNGWASAQPWLVIVICGSSASWMLSHVVKERGGLHNRVTRRLRLSALSLAESEEYLRARHVELGHYQILELTMAVGGVPHYLNQAKPGQSAAQCIDRACFSPDGLLHDEFQNLYAALFERAERHEAMVRALARGRGGLDRHEALRLANMPSGGTASKVLDELVESGFVTSSAPLWHKQRDALHRLTDEYSLFYLSWIESHRGAGTGTWLKKRASPRFRAWSGLAFENICLRHIPAIKRALGIGAVETEDAPWVHRPTGPDDRGVQIDLVIDRADQSINLCEMKFAESEFVLDKAYARELEEKREVFRRVTRTRKSVFLTLVTTYGLRRSEH
ncbi:MAG: hypothetical protein JNK04_00420, partial [Myxococcales bacterium]|nr:hypothetical protein [Myxococcales bacterium]